MCTFRFVCIPTVCSRWKGLSIQSALFWSLHGPLSVYQGHSSCVCLASRPGCLDTPVSGRLVSPGLVQKGDPLGKGRCYTFLSPAWNRGQPGQISPKPLSHRHVSGDDNREPLFEGFPPLRRGFRPCSHRLLNFYPASGKASLPARSFVVSVSACARGSSLYAFASAGAPPPVGFRGQVHRDLDSFERVGPLMVVERQPPSSRSLPGGPAPRPALLVRCLRSRLRHQFSRSICFGSLVARGALLLDQSS